MIKGIKALYCFIRWPYEKIKRTQNYIRYNVELKRNSQRFQLPDLREKNPKKTFFVIYREVDDIGFGSQLYVAIHQIAYAEKKKYIPVIHRKLKESENPLSNQWEECFLPVQLYELKDVYSSKNLIICSNKLPPNGTFYDFWNISKRKLIKYQQLFQKYIHLNEPMKHYIVQLWMNMFNENDRILGVLLRGSDYNETVAYGHPRQPTLKEALNMIEKIKMEYHCNKIFLATEDSKILHDLKKHYKDNCLYYIDQERVDREDYKTINYILCEKNIDKKKMLRDYIAAIYILSRCQCLVCGNTSASNILPLISDSYECMYRFDLGTYPKGDYSKLLK